VCPVDCIQSDDDATQYFIDPDECIDCGACVDTCPVQAIYAAEDVPEQWSAFVEVNAAFFRD
jgi:NAD-dependent dihydropyrimidine dehydrogenase PreA subunit